MLLLERGADPDQKDIEGRCSNRCTDIAFMRILTSVMHNIMPKYYFGVNVF